MLPLTIVPLPEPRSTRIQPSAVSWMMSKCLRDTAMSVSTTSLSIARPIVYVLPGRTSSSCPVSLPAVITRRASITLDGGAISEIAAFAC